MGAWIETKYKVEYETKDGVAPRMGAWIETTATSFQSARNSGRAPHGRVD